MLTLSELEALFAELKTPEKGRQLIRQILEGKPVRSLQHRNDTVRTRFLSAKMNGAALYAESRTVELAAFVWYEHDPAVSAFYPQPCALDLSVGGMKGGRTRIQHTPDNFLVSDGKFYFDEWRMEDRLLRLSEERPHHFQKDGDNVWHYVPAEEHCAKLGITHRLRSADELPRKFLANMRFLQDYGLETAPPVPLDIATELMALLAEHKRVPHLQLIYRHGFKADHIFPMVLNGRLYVDLFNVRCDQVEELVIYPNKLVARADAVLAAARQVALPGCVLELRPGFRFVYDQKPYDIKLVGATDVIVQDEGGNTTNMPIALVKELHDKTLIDIASGQKTEREYDLNRVVANERLLERALGRMDALNNRDSSDASDRSVRRWKSKVDGISDPQQKLLALTGETGGNRAQRLPAPAIDAAVACLDKHNRPAKPTVQSTYGAYLALCGEIDVTPMSRSTFYVWIRGREDIAAREGKRKAYQKAPIPLTFDYEQPVHGVQPHDVAYCDHTPMNILLKGLRLPNLGKPTLTLITDGAISMPRAFALLYRPAGTAAVLMALRDYARRWGCLPRTLVLDNGKEFHSNALKAIASLFGIDLRWRRRSKPRDSTLVERALGVTEQELLSSLNGNSIALKNPREVSSAVKPENFIEWTLPALHGSLQHFLFEVQAKRIHPRFGMTPKEWENRLLIEYGSRSHRMVRFDALFKLMTSPHPKSSSTRELDRRKGVFVDGRFHWNDIFATCTVQHQTVEVREELWNGSVVYVCLKNEWVVAQARDGSRLEGRFSYEVEMQAREEAARQPAAAAKDRNTKAHAYKKQILFDPKNFDDRLREQCMEEYRTYEKLGMVEALPEAANPRATEFDLGTPRTSDLALIRSIEKEPDANREQSRSSEKDDVDASADAANEEGADETLAAEFSTF